MNIVVSATGTTPESAVDPRFGRAKYFIVYDSVARSFTAHDNAVNLNAMQGAGIQAAQTVVDLGAQAVVTGNVGPKAFRVLDAAHVTIHTGAAGTVRDAVAACEAGTLDTAAKASVEGHWM